MADFPAIHLNPQEVATRTRPMANASIAPPGPQKATLSSLTQGRPMSSSPQNAPLYFVSRTHSIVAMLGIVWFAFSARAHAQPAEVDIVGTTAALSTVAQRHLVRIQPSGHAPVLLMAVENDGYSNHDYGLLWYRSDDEGATWSFYKDVLAGVSQVYDASLHPQTLHL